MTPLTLTIRALLLASDRPLTVGELVGLLPTDYAQLEDASRQVKQSLEVLAASNESDCLELNYVASGFRYQLASHYTPSVSKLWEQKAYRYSKALIETLSIIAWKQPVTRGEVEDIRGISSSANIFRILMDREWIKLVGYRDSLGKPAEYGTTNAFLDYFNLTSIKDLPTLPEPRTVDALNKNEEQKNEEQKNDEQP